MKEILLTQGKITLVDDDDFEMLAPYKWIAEKQKKTFYASRGIIDPATGRQAHLKMHRIILGVIDPKIFVDHIDRDGLNNQKSNLRVCTISQNNCNKSPKASGSSKYLGVHWDKNLSKWRVKLRKNKKTLHIGLFINEEEAAMAYNAAAAHYHGQFASFNKIPTYV